MTKMQLEINKNVEIFYGKTNVPLIDDKMI